MDNFCAQCGTHLDQNGLCPKCNPSLSNQQPIMPTAEKPNRKKILIPVIGILIVVVAVAIACFFIFGGSSSTSSTNNHIAIENNGYSLYSPDGRLYDVSDPEHIVELQPSKELSAPQKPTNNKTPLNSQTVFCDGVIYGRNTDYLDLYRYVITNDGVKEEVWVSKDEFEDQGMSEYMAAGFRNPVLCGDYIYFTYIQSLEFWYEEREDLYKLGRISFDGEVELFDDLHASAIASDGDYIYFLDNGYIVDAPGIDEDRLGLYKLQGNADPEDAVLITNDLDIDVSIYEQSPGHRIFEQMKLFGDTIYYLEVNLTGQNRLCATNTDGSDRKIVFEKEPMAFYEIDTDNDILYYVEGVYPSSESYSVCSVPLSRTNQIYCLFETKGITDIELCDDYLYFQNTNHSSFPGEGGNKATMGFRYNIKEKVMEVMYGYYEGKNELEIDPQTGGYIISDNRGESIIYWEEERVSSDTVFEFKYG